MNQKFIKTTNTSITIFLVIAILAVVNFLSYQVFYRFDLTQGKDFSISPASKQSAKNLDDIVNIKGYFSENLPNQYVTLKQEVGDILEEYANYSNGKIKYEFIDPKDDKEMQKTLYYQGIPQLQFNVLEKDKYQVVNGYLGITVEYGGKKEVIPVVQDTGNLEYQLTLAIKKVTGKIQAKIGYVTSNKTLTTDGEISEGYKKISEMYEVSDIDLSKGEIAGDITTLIIAGPKEKFNDKELKAIDAFVMRGGNLLVLADGVKIEKGLAASKNDLGLDKLLGAYGLKLNNDIVADVSSGMASFNQGFMTFTTNYPYWPKIIKSGFDKNNPAVSKLESIVLPWASSVETTDKMDKADKISELLKTTDKAWTQTDNYNLNPQTAMEGKNDSKSRLLGISVMGKFKSAFGDKDGNARIILVGDSDFVSDNFLKNSPDNLVLFQNLVDSLSLDEDLINIRSKGISERPIKELSDGEKAFMRYGNIFGITVIVISFGMIRYFLRRRSRFVDEI